MIYLGLFAIAAGLAASLTPAVRALGRRWGLLDLPGERKIHTVSVPRIGGVGVTLAAVVALAIVTALGWASVADVTAWLPALLGVVIVFGVGLRDDLKPVRPVVKLVFQVLAALVAVAMGVRIDHLTLFGTTHPLGWLGVPATVLWIVGLTNAFNLMDGLDGLATGLAIIAAATCGAVSISRGDTQGGLLLVALLGALCGFLPYNFNPATIFLGDSGSLVVGHVLAVTAINGWQKGATALAVAVPLLIFALPISETVLSMIRRTRGQGIWHIFSADQQHLHYQLLGLGLSHRGAVLLLYVVSLSLSLLALATMQMR
ncbi:MAG TPA: MraY family glycosyltransferase [Methylomirabilota bacterium]|nr:MraY family glycosyltransferase [Methylomirabilota bacterium]